MILTGLSLCFLKKKHVNQFFTVLSILSFLLSVVINYIYFNIIAQLFLVMDIPYSTNIN